LLLPRLPWWILVIDDSTEVRHSIAEYLRTAGFDVRTATGPDALRMLRESTAPPGLVLLDWMMPEVSGIDVLHELRSDPRHSSARVVVITGLGTRTANEVEIGAWGVSKVLRKPISGKELLAVVNDVRAGQTIK
jgi:two-component system phosphate regulon response regulator PhoB